MFIFGFIQIIIKFYLYKVQGFFNIDHKDNNI